VLRLVGAPTRALGFSAAPNDDEARKNLRRTSLTVLGALTDDPWVRREAEAATVRWLRDPSAVDGDTAAVALPIASRGAGAARFDALRTALDRATNTPQERAIILHAMVTFDDLAQVRRAYELVLTDAIRVQDLRVVFGRTGASPAARALLLDWGRERYDALSAKLGRHTRSLVGALGGRCDEASIREGEDFLRARVGEMEGVARSLRQAGEVARQCVAVRGREAGRAAAVFARR
jgi:hypothetical protein